MVANYLFGFCVCQLPYIQYILFLLFEHYGHRIDYFRAFSSIVLVLYVRESVFGVYLCRLDFVSFGHNHVSESSANFLFSLVCVTNNNKNLNFIVAPETVKIRVEPVELVPGAEATLICDSSSSNPPAKLSWWKDGISVEGLNNSSKPGLWGGMVSSLELKVNVTQEMNGVLYMCQSHNDALVRSVHEAVTLQVLCKYMQLLYAPKQTLFINGDELLRMEFFHSI